MSNLRAAAQQALEALEADCGGRCNAEYNPCWQREAAETLRAALVEDAMQKFTDVNQELEAALGCDHCNQPLYAAVKCRVCGRVTEPVQEPVSLEVHDRICQDLYRQIRGLILDNEKLRVEINRREDA